MNVLENQNRLYSFFPSYLTSDVKKVIEILPLNAIITSIDGSRINVIHETYQEINLNDEILKINARVYFPEPSLENERDLTALQQIILHCIYLRHSDGFIRERRTAYLVHSNECFVVPFMVQLLGEYVLNIIKLIDKHIDHGNIETYKKFISENPDFWRLTKNRIVSYWNEYHRRQYRYFNEYIGHHIIEKLEKQI